jgi:hypothetical protein
VTAVLMVGYLGLSVWLPWNSEQQAIRMVERWGGGVGAATVGPLWFRQPVDWDRMGDFNVFRRVFAVFLRDTAITDAALESLTKPVFLKCSDHSMRMRQQMTAAASEFQAW